MVASKSADGCYEKMSWVVIAILFFPCVAPSNLRSQEFYPLGVGNFWRYSVIFQGDSVGYYDVAIPKDTVMPNGSRYFLFQPIFASGGFDRVDDSLNIYQYDEDNKDGDISTDELLLDRMGSLVMQTWIGFRYHFPTYSVKEDYFYATWFDSTVAVNQIAYYQYDSTSQGPGLFAGMLQFSAKHGIVLAVLDGGVSYELYGARIGGTAYGTITGLCAREATIPSDFHVYPAYPNPFNSSTIIQYDVDEPGRVLIDVFTLHGVHALSYDAGQLPRGRYQFRWDASNQISSGVYIIRIGLEKKSVAQKLIFVE